MNHAVNGNVRIFHESFGSPADPTLLLVNGLGNQCLSFRDEFCQQFVQQGYRVLRFDNRDVGASTECSAEYTLSDMAADAVAVLDANDVERAHVMGFSLGGMIVQVLAIEHPTRLVSATSVMSTTGDSDVGHPSAEARELLLTKGSTDRSAAIEAHLAGQRVWGSPGHVEWNVQAELAGRLFDRACRPEGVGRQYRAARRDGSRTERLASVTVPFLVLHGTADTLIDISGGRRTASAVPGARFVEIEGMGHDYPRHFWSRLVAEFHEFALQSISVRSDDPTKGEP
jgi:pimeloyl-ACP methyl ester carboxylesterase